MKMKTSKEKLEIGKKIWVLHHNGFSIKEISCKLGVSTSIVSTILNYSVPKILEVPNERYWDVIHILVEQIQILKQKLKSKGEKDESTK